MQNFSEWDIVPDFTGEQVAALVLGKNPRDSDFKSTSAEPALELVKRGYGHAKTWHYECLRDSYPANGSAATPQEALPSVELKVKLNQIGDDYTDHDFWEWLKSDASAFERQTFLREDVSRWVKANKWKSEYQFSAAEWAAKPLSTKEENTLLKMIYGMAIAYHGYDHHMHKSGVPTEISEDLNKVGIDVHVDTVRGWLKKAGDNVTRKT